jgi:conjugative relaxase-like TrwC/TraI family protein
MRATLTFHYPQGAPSNPLRFVLSINKLRVGQEAYQLSGVAESLDAYYSGAGEAHGEWLGGSAARLGLSGRVRPEDLQAVLAGIRPGTGGLDPNGGTIRPHPRRVPGFDLTFKVPKSASVLYAVSDDPRVQAAVIEAGQVAMHEAVGWLEREAIRVQRGSHNTAYLERLDPTQRAKAGPRRETTSGVIAASFRHRTSRAGDPYLHWHVLVANLVQGADGRWSSFAHPELYRHATAAGEVFQAAFRAELTDSLGVEWKPGRHVPEIAGIPQHVLDVFSKRSAEIEAWLDSTGTANTPEGRQQAVLATRRLKPEVEIGSTRFDTDWKLEAEAAGWGPEHADGLIAACADRHRIDFDAAWRLATVGLDEHGNVEEWERTVEPDEWIADLLRRDLTSDRSTFTAADITRAVAARMGAGATVATIERLTHRVVASPHTIAVTTDSGPQQYTSRELAEVEQRFIATLASTRRTPLPVDAVNGAIAARSLGDDQVTAVRSLCDTTGDVSVLVGPAGTGKTYTLDAIAAAYRKAGIGVAGVAPSARAALELADATGIATATMHRALHDWRSGLDGPAAGSLLIIDEAGMADIRTLTDVVEHHLEAGGHVLLAGDHRQLPEIGAGGGFGHAAHHAPCIAELSVNRRQHDTWEQDALEQLRDGHVATAVGAYLDQGRVTVAATDTDLVNTAIDMWTAARHDGLHPVMLAGRNELVDQLNAAAIERLLTTGELDDNQPAPYGSLTVRVGERVVLRRNHQIDHGSLPVANGQTGTITAVGDHVVGIALDSGTHVTLDGSYLNRGGYLSHAYALTTHRAQGGTWDLAIAVGADTLTREAAYVQLSRGRRANQILLTDPEHAALRAELDAERHDRGLIPPDEQIDPIDEHLSARLNRSAAKQLAHTIDPDLDTITTWTRTATLVDLETFYRSAAWAEQIATSAHGTTRAQLLDQRHRLDDVARHIAVGVQVSPHDRNNVGTVTAIDDTHGAATVHFIGRTGSEATRTFKWEELRVITPTPAERSLPPDGQAALDHSLQTLDARIADYDRTLADHGIDPGDHRLYNAAIHHKIDQHTAVLLAEQPDWLTTLAGQPPSDAIGFRTWRESVALIARHQLRYGIDDGIGEPPHDGLERSEWIRIVGAIVANRHWIHSSERQSTLPAAIRSEVERYDRLIELDDLIATAPADTRQFVAQLQHGQLSLDDTAELLQTALAQQDARHNWIIEHWPHIVEYQELLAVDGPATTNDVAERVLSVELDF